MSIFDDDFFDMMDDIEMFDKSDKEKQCKKCPEYKSCRANYKKCKYQKKNGLFF